MNESELADRLEEKLGLDFILGNDVRPEPVETPEPEAAAEAVEETEEVAEDDAPPAEAGDRPRDEKGRFVKTEEVDETEPEAVEESAAEKLYAGKYKSPEDLESAYEALQQRLGSQGSEVGQLRQELEALRAQMQQPQQQQQQSYNSAPLTQEHLEWADEVAQQNPEQGALWAYENSPELYEAVMDAWFEYDPRGARRFEQNVLRHELRQEIMPALAPVRQMSQQQEFATAWQAVQQQHPDLDQYADTILDVAQNAPEVVRELQNANVETKQRVLTNLLFMARGRDADTLREAVRQEAVQRAEETRRTKQEASVVTASSAPSRGDTSQARLDAFKRQFRQEVGLPTD